MGTIQVKFLGGAAGARVVDNGRAGLGRFALPKGGPVDGVAHLNGARLVGNGPTQVVVEIPLRGGQWQLTGSGVLAFTGADMDWNVNGKALPLNTPRKFSDEATLRGEYARSGQYGYLHIGGEWQLADNFGSVQPLLPSHLEIQPGWECTVISKPYQESENETLPEPLPSSNWYTFTPGLEWSGLSEAWRSALLTYKYLISPTSNRQGIRLRPALPFPDLSPPPAIISSPVLPGTLQFTGEEIIVLGPDAQTIGGYPRLGWVDADVLARLYQARLGTQVAITH